MVITFDSSHFAVIAYEILKNRLFDEKKLLGMVICLGPGACNDVYNGQ